MMELADLLLSRPVVVGLALVGGILATLGAIAMHKGGLIHPKLAKFMLRFGYAVFWASVVLFIVAGFKAAYD